MHQHTLRGWFSAVSKLIFAEKVCMHGPFRHHHPSGSIPSISSAQDCEGLTWVNARCVRNESGVVSEVSRFDPRIILTFHEEVCRVFCMCMHFA